MSKISFWSQILSKIGYCGDKKGYKEAVELRDRGDLNASFAKFSQLVTNYPGCQQYRFQLGKTGVLLNPKGGAY